MEVMETQEQIHEAAHGHGGEHGEHGASGGHEGGSKKYVAILISILACLLALIETGVNSSQTSQIAHNIEASDLWAFYQAKTIRKTTMETAAELMEASKPINLSPEQEAVWKKRISDWRTTAQRYESEPEKGEGRKELRERAINAQKIRDKASAAHHMFEYGAAALQIAIVMASASVVTNMLLLVWGAGFLGVLGIAFGLLGWLAPTLIHL
ncbi:DUF4337 domain-containing protein [Candidatus Magnetaquicoccus inordinatus]|uniref:DUF4337 domain-containing protein n=1 Tax=Candidatus Magnetaquicoccus inordinatus TaxID=2496818 RepID=UPI00102B0676|nr:DUF4337 domain-containing protein [Candidatus Magnetaquicoccus inordinatus]